MAQYNDFGSKEGIFESKAALPTNDFESTVEEAWY